ncbi:hypothetical protein D9756_010036 [Leucocoprinus leucothites]|uniref:lytic cellulose monooxygenase (C4-dehydrogenating) n=1 Tax=Leucocoprinus leucothites TaxID=201217 RepID=A0A8H5CR77_9AGAR|nr:hypothetical protein D9756_010036 [Leucoagaricus leucothites]
MKSTISLFLPLLAAASAYAHGFVADLNVAGKDYKGDVPAGAKNPSVIRLVSDISPVKGANNPDVNCGLNAGPATLSAKANPGDKISFNWRGGDNEDWPHNTGPMLTYMASCGDQTCDNFDSTQAKWFKIQQVGETSSGAWAQADLMKGKTADITLPSNIAPGNYLIRHEIIALHLAENKGGAEFYPSCAQLTVGGSGTGKPKDSELVSLPGAYSDTDPGILVKNVYNDNLKYQFPGPPIASFVSGGSSGDSSDGDSGSGASGTATAGGSRPTSSSDDSGSGGSSPSKCKLKKGKGGDDDGANSRRSLNVKYYPRHVSRVMRDLAFGNAHSHTRAHSH